MTGTSLVILAMYSTVNVVGPSGSHVSPDALPWLFCLLMVAAVLTSVAMYHETNIPNRTAPKKVPLDGLSRRHPGPKSRRA